MCLSFPLLGEMIQFDKLFLQFCVGFSTTNYCSPFLGGVKLLLVVTFQKQNEKKTKKQYLQQLFPPFFASVRFSSRNESTRPRYILVLRFWHPGLTEANRKILMPMSQGQLLYLFCSMYLVFMFSIIYYIYLISFLIASYTVQYGFICRIMYLLHVILVYIYIRIHIIHETDSENAPKELKRLYTFVH